VANHSLARLMTELYYESQKNSRILDLIRSLKKAVIKDPRKDLPRLEVAFALWKLIEEIKKVLKGE